MGDQRFILEHAVRLLQGLVDVISSCGWLTPALFAMELSQMIVQATTSQGSPLLQLPHFTTALVERAKKSKVEDVFDVMNMDEEPRKKLFSDLSPSQFMVVVRLGRDGMEEGESLGAVYAPFYPKEKEESWW